MDGRNSGREYQNILGAILVLNLYRRPALCIICAVIVSLSTSALAQTSGALEEIIVTAQKREQSLDTIGITIDAFTGETMRQSGVNSLIDLSQYSPGLNIRGPFGDFGYPIITLRGVNTDGFIETLPQATGVYTDGVYLSQPPMLTLRMFDLERVEVLKGPQGTIYGRNTIAGAVNFISKRPALDESDGYFELGYGRYGRTNLEAAYGSALSDTVAMRGAVKYLAQSDGPLTNTNSAVGDGGEIDQLSGRVSFVFAPSDDVDVYLQLHASRDNSDVWPFSIVPGGEDTDGDGIPDQMCNDFFVGNVEAAQQNCLARDPFGTGNTFNDTDGDPYTNNLSGIGQHENRAFGGVLEVNWAVGNIELTSVTGYEDYQRKDQLDEDAGPFAAIDNTRRSDISQFSQEFRALSTRDSGLTWLAGLYFSDDELVGDPGFDNGRRDYSTLDTQTFALFGQVEVPVAERLTLIVGGRYTDVDRGFKYTTSSTGSPFNANPADVAFTDDDWSGSLRLDWQMNDDSLLYGSISRGFNAGTYNSQFLNDLASLIPTKSESLTAYEVGVKSRYKDGRVGLTAAAFYYDYQDPQVVAVVPTGTIDTNRLTNADDATLSGFEFQLRLLPADWLDINLGVSYVNSEYGFLLSPAPATGTGSPFPYNDPIFGAGQILQLEGESFPNVPEWSFNSTIRTTFPVNADWHLVAQADFLWEDDIKRDLIDTQALYTRSHWNIDARLILQSEDDSWYSILWVKNLADDTWITEAYQVLGFGFYIAGANYNYPRTYGINIGRNF